MKRTLISLIGLVIFAVIMPAQARDADLGFRFLMGDSGISTWLLEIITRFLR